MSSPNFDTGNGGGGYNPDDDPHPLRLLFSATTGTGHLRPLLPLAHAARAAGHHVAFSCFPALLPEVRAAGFHAFPAGSDPCSLPGLLARIGEPAAQPASTAPAQVAAVEARVLAEGFAGVLARHKARETLAVCAAFSPDLFVCEELDFGGMIAAEQLGRPHALVTVFAAGTFLAPEIIAPPLDHLRTTYGLLPDPHLAMPARHLVLSPIPPSFRDPACPFPATARALRQTDVADPDARPPAWLARLPPARPLVYLSLGTQINTICRALFAPLIAALGDLPVELVVTVGRDLDPTTCGPQAPHIHIARFIPQHWLLPRCALVVTHGGSGTVIGALAHGVPLVVVPFASDQAANAAWCVALGVGRVVEPFQETGWAVGEAARAVLADPEYRVCAERVREEIAALPGPEEAVRLLERLGRDGRLHTSQVAA